MSSHDRVALAEKRQREYRPHPKIREKLADISITLLIGPTAIGKSHLINKVTEFDDQFTESGTITNRPPRESDPENYVTDVPLETMLNRIEKREFVQYGVVPPDKIYATDLNSYPSNHIILPALASSIDSFKNYGFKKVIPIGVLADGEEWQQRLGERRNNRDYASRLQEAIESVNWLLKKYPSIPIVENESGEDKRAAREIIRLSKERGAPVENDDDHIIELGRQLIVVALRELE